jgi:hypothetical protein
MGEQTRHRPVDIRDPGMDGGSCGLFAVSGHQQQQVP